MVVGYKFLINSCPGQLNMRPCLSVIVAKGVKISTNQFPPPQKLAPKISSFSRAFPKN